jgi:hypothetical protein
MGAIPHYFTRRAPFAMQRRRPNCLPLARYARVVHCVSFVNLFLLGNLNA